MTEVEKMFIDFIEDWCKVEMKYYEDPQYGKGNFKKLVEKAKTMISDRDEKLKNEKNKTIIP